MCVVSPVSARHVVSVAENDGHFTFYTVYTPRRPGCRPPLGAPGAGVCCIVMRIQNGGVRSEECTGRTWCSDTSKGPVQGGRGQRREGVKTMLLKYELILYLDQITRPRIYPLKSAPYDMRLMI